MKIHYCSSFEELSRLGSETILSELGKNPKQLICAATGNSPSGTYQNLASFYTKQPKVFEKLRILKLDEWGGIPSTDPNSCETFIQKKILQPLHISEDRYISFKSNPTNPEKECERIQNEIEQKGPIDVCILGLGQNGHLGFNEPSKSLITTCHIAQLSEKSLEHQMIKTMKNKPTYGLTLGMGDILKSKKIILLITGDNKESVISKFLSKQITTHLPATFLWLHPDVECYIDKSSL